MKIEQLENKGLEYKFLLSLDSESMDKEFSQTLQTIAQNYKKPGFRPGKVPLKVIEKEFGHSVLQEQLEKKVQSAIENILADNKITPLRPPRLKRQGDTGYVYEIHIEQLPEFELKSLSETTLERLEAQITEEELDTFVNKLQRLMGTFEEVDRIVENDDFVDVRYTVRLDGKVVDDLAEVEDRIDLKSPGVDHVDIAQHLVGLKKGEEKTIQKPGRKLREELKDKTLEVSYVIDAVQVCTPHEVNDELLARLKSPDIESFRGKLKASLEGTTRRMSYMHSKRQLLDSLSDQYNFDVPESMILDESKMIEQKIKEEKANNPDFTEEVSNEEIMVLSKRRVQLGILIGRMSKEYNISVSNDHIIMEMLRRASQLSKDPTPIVSEWVKRSDIVSYFRAELTEIAVIDYLMKNSNVTEKQVSVRELYEEASDFLSDSYEFDGLFDDDDEEETEE